MGERHIRKDGRAAGHVPTVDTDPYQALLRAVLTRAIGDAIGCIPDKSSWNHRTRIKNARGWIDGEVYEPWSFRWVCEGLDLDYRRMRRGIWKVMAARDHRPSRLKQFGAPAVEKLLCIGS